MDQIHSFIDQMKRKGQTESIINLSRELLAHYESEKEDISDTLTFTRTYCEKHLAGTEEAANKIIILFWYCDFLQDKTCSTYLITLLGTLNVIENQEKRLQKLFGKNIADTIYANLNFPLLGSDLQSYPEAIKHYLDQLRKSLTEEQCQRVLAGNHHEVDPNNFAEDKRRFLATPDFANFLKKKHLQLVETLSEHAKTGKLWFEQHITPEVVEYVKDHQEIQTGILDGERIIVQKIPYNPDAWLKQVDLKRKRYYACHCPFVRSAILMNIKVSDLWCYCSGGFSKLIFDYLFDEELEVELLESVLSGAEFCRFAIKLPHKKTDTCGTGVSKLIS